MTPVSPHDLQQITRLPDGSHEARILSQVRYSDLEARKRHTLRFHLCWPG